MQLLFLMQQAAMAHIVDDVITAPFRFFEAIRRDAVHLPSGRHVVILDVLDVQVVLHDVPVPVSVHPLVIQGLQHVQHLRVMGLVRDDAVVVRQFAFVARRQLRIETHGALHFARIHGDLGALLHARVVELLADRIELAALAELVRGFEDAEVLLIGHLGLMGVKVAIRHNVEVLDRKMWNFSHRSVPLLALRAFPGPLPMMNIMGQVRHDVEVGVRGRGDRSALAHPARLARRTVAQAHGILTRSQRL
mmetsp:Transcript_35414/g.101825  ORF Transcript_35414/g.101825 Transcript_35414/m.101825 type:complete len:249 (-) Transcript_35414:414-1160(-)